MAPLLEYAVDLKLFVKDDSEMAEIVCSRKSFIDQPHSSTRVSTSGNVKNVVVIVKPDIDKPGIYLRAAKLVSEVLNGPEGMSEFSLDADISISSVNNAEDALPNHVVTEYGFFSMRPIAILDQNLLTVVYKKNRQFSISSGLPNITLSLDESVFQVGQSLLAAFESFKSRSEELDRKGSVTKHRDLLQVPYSMSEAAVDSEPVAPFIFELSRISAISLFYYPSLDVQSALINFSLSNLGVVLHGDDKVLQAHVDAFIQDVSGRAGVGRQELCSIFEPGCAPLLQATITSTAELLRTDVVVLNNYVGMAMTATMFESIGQAMNGVRRLIPK